MRYKTITITPPDADLSDVLVRIKLDADTDVGAVCQPNGYDVYFTTSDGSTRLPFSRLEWSVTDGAASGQCDVLCDIPVSGITVRMYYGGVASTDPQNRDATYANYLAVYPLNTLSGSVFEDISGNGKHLTKPNWEWELVEDPTYGKMVKYAGGGHQNTCRWINLTYNGTMAVSEVFSGTQGNGLAGWTDSATYCGRVSTGENSVTIRLSRTSNASNTISVLTTPRGYCTYNYPVDGSPSSEVTLRVNSVMASGSADQTAARLSSFTLFPVHLAQTNAGSQQRDVRVHKGALSIASADFEYLNLPTGAGVTFGIEQRIKRRRHSNIIDFI